MAKRRKAKRASIGVSLKRRRSGLRGALTRAIRAKDPARVSRAADKLASELRPKKDAAEARLARQLSKAVTSGHAADAEDPRIQALTREVVRNRRSPIEEAPWFLDSHVADLNAYCVEPGALLSHYVREKDAGRIIWNGNLQIPSRWGFKADWRKYWTRCRAKLREVIRGLAGSWEMFVLIEDRCL